MTQSETDSDGSIPVDESLTPPSASDTSGYGLMLTLVGAILLALAYYGVIGMQSGRALGSALPEPFYLLAFAILFVIEILNQRTLSPVAFGRAIALSVVYGGLFVFAAEGGAYIWEFPSLVLINYRGITVFAISLVAAVLLYAGYLTVVETDTSVR